MSKIEITGDGLNDELIYYYTTMIEIAERIKHAYGHMREIDEICDICIKQAMEKLEILK